jgi:hypothetical protein
MLNPKRQAKTKALFILVSTLFLTVKLQAAAEPLTSTANAALQKNPQKTANWNLSIGAHQLDGKMNLKSSIPNYSFRDQTRKPFQMIGPSLEYKVTKNILLYGLHPWKKIVATHIQAIWRGYRVRRAGLTT